MVISYITYRIEQASALPTYPQQKACPSGTFHGALKLEPTMINADTTVPYSPKGTERRLAQQNPVRPQPTLLLYHHLSAPLAPSPLMRSPC